MTTQNILATATRCLTHAASIDEESVTRKQKEKTLRLKQVLTIAVAVSLCFLLSNDIRSQSQHINQGRGFDPNGVYATSNIDSINVFNGNLVVNVPIGGTYKVGGNLSYSLNLYYNSNLWTATEVGSGGTNLDYNQFTVWTAFTHHQDGTFVWINEPLVSPDTAGVANRHMGDPNQSYTDQEPNANATAGMGWQLILGRLFPPRGGTADLSPLATEQSNWIYEAPDGSEHAFYSCLHLTDTAEPCDADPNTDAVTYTRDNTYLRMRVVGAYRYVDFPNGVSHVFTNVGTSQTGPDWRLVRMEDTFGNNVNVTYDIIRGPDGKPLSEVWTIQDPFRKHIINLEKETPDYQPVIKSVRVAAFRDAVSPTATYTFRYSSRPIPRALPHPPAEDGYSQNVTVPFLDSVEQPDGSRYSMPVDSGSYDLDGTLSSLKTPGILRKMTLPTGASLEWVYLPDQNQTGYYGYPRYSAGRNYARRSVGVRSRILTDGGMSYTWKYDPKIGPLPGSCPEETTSSNCAIRLFSNTVTNPPTEPGGKGDYTVTYFSVYPFPFDNNSGRSPEAWHVAEYGLPMNKDVSVTDANNKPLFLSSQVFRGDGTLMRSTYVRYETDTVPINDGWGGALSNNRRLVASRTVYEDDPAPGGSKRFADVYYNGFSGGIGPAQQFDGLGHYRRVDTNGNFDGENVRSTRTNYNQSVGNYYIDPTTNQPGPGLHTYTGDQFFSNPNTPWLLETYDATTATEGSKSSWTYYDFNSDGSLHSKRILKLMGSATAAPNINSHDIRIVYGYTQGDVTNEKYFGGDNTNADGGTPEYTINHHYQAGSLQWTQNAASGFKSYDTDIDDSTGLVWKSRDEAGAVTEFNYDKLGRVSAIQPQSSSWTQVVYTPFGSQLPTQTQCGIQAAGIASAPTVNVYHRNNNSTTGDTLDEERYEYDGLGRLKVETRKMPGCKIATSRQTLHDGLGRVTSVSEWGNFGKKTQYNNYDPFGRAQWIRMPDDVANSLQHDVRLTYRGVSKVDRVVRIGTSCCDASGNVNESDAKTTEFYDRQGRLSGIDEFSNGTSPNPVTTSYGYDVGSRITSATTKVTVPSTPLPPKNVAASANGGVASASSIANAFFPASSAIDGDRKGRMWANGGGWNDGSQGDYSLDWVRVDFNGVKSISQVNVYTLSDRYAGRTDDPLTTETFNTAPNTGQGITSFDVQYLSGSGWITVDCGNTANPCGRIYDNNKVLRQVSFPTVQTTAVRVAVHAGALWTSIPNNYSRIVEVEALGTATTDQLWVDDAIPSGGIPMGDNEGWNWVTSNPSPSSGSQSHQSNLVAGMHQHFFMQATQKLTVATGDKLFAYVYLDPANPPSEVMLQWGDGAGWDHRAFWGKNELGWGADGTAARRWMGPLPPAGQWVRLEVPASMVGLEGKTADAMAFSLNGGRATWDRAGKSVPTGSITNMALSSNGGVASASSVVNANYPVSAVNDGDRKGANWGKGGFGSGWNDATEGEFASDRLRVDFNGSKTINEIDVYTLSDTYSSRTTDPSESETFSTPNSGQGITSFDVQYLNNGAWTNVPAGRVVSNNNVLRKFTFAPITTSAIRVLVRDGALWTAIPNNYSRIVELEAYEVQSTAPPSVLYSQTRSFSYDNRGFLATETLPELAGGTIQYSNYDSLGNVGSKIDGSHNVSYYYDPLGRQTSVQETVTENGYTQTRPLKEFYYYSDNTGGLSRGKLRQAVRHNNILNPVNGNPVDVMVTTSYEYRKLEGMLSRRAMNFSMLGGVDNFVQTFDYDPMGNLTSQSYPQCSANTYCGPVATPRTINYTYDGSELASVSGHAVLGYNANGTLGSISHGNGVTDTYAMDADYMQRPSKISTTGANANWDSGTYKYDGVGNVTKIGADWYLYDSVNRLIEGTAIASANTSEKKKQHYAYDAFGNLNTIDTYVNVGTPSESLASHFAMDVDLNTNRLNFIPYDMSGNLLGGPNQPTTYRYDSLNVMENAPSKTYLYDVNDQRVWIYDASSTTSVETVVLRGLNDEVLREYQVLGGNGANHWSWQKDYVYAGTKLITTLSPSPYSPSLTSYLYYHTDHLGTPRMITNGSAQRMSFHQYLPFGEEATSPYQDTDRLKFTGHERDNNYPPGHLLDYMHARYYGVYQGRFLSIDPGRDIDAKHPQSWNSYAYVRNNVMNATDPTGRDMAGIASSLMSLATTFQTSSRLDMRAVLPEFQPMLLEGFNEAVMRITTIKTCAYFFNWGNAAGALQNDLDTLADTKYVFAPMGGPTWEGVTGAGTVHGTHTVLINKLGPFVNENQLILGPGNQPARHIMDLNTGLKGAQLKGLILLHELGHEIRLFKPDRDNPKLSEFYTRSVLEMCYPEVVRPPTY